MNDLRVYLVYDDTIDNSGVYVLAKNRKEAPTIAGINYTNVKWCASYKVQDGFVVDQFGSVKGKLKDDKSL